MIKPYSEACERNREPILTVIRPILSGTDLDDPFAAVPEPFTGVDVPGPIRDEAGPKHVLCLTHVCYRTISACG